MTKEATQQDRQFARMRQEGTHELRRPPLLLVVSWLIGVVDHEEVKRFEYAVTKVDDVNGASQVVRRVLPRKEEDEQ